MKPPIRQPARVVGAPRSGPAAAESPAAGLPLRRWRSAELFGSGQEIEIAHGRLVYRLRLTALGKLILTK